MSNLSERTTLAEVEAFVDGNIVKARKDEIRCGDGRTTPEQSNGAIRAFGEDFGMMLAIKGALWERGQHEVDNQKLIESYLDAVRPERGEAPKLFLHTDVHSKENGEIGCGHIKLSSSQGGEIAYIVPDKEANGLYQAILNRPELNVQVLEGEHAEQAALLVYSEMSEEGNRYSVNSRGTDEKGSYFVVDMEGIRDHFELIVPQISKALGLEFTPEEAMTAYEKQQNESAEVLAFSKGLEAYRVDIDSSGAASTGKIS